MSNRIDHGGNCALRKIGTPEGWTIYAWERLDDGSVLYRMALERPPGADGCRKWNTEQGKAVAVSQAEVSAEYARYEAETGKCGECGGHGGRWVGWNRDTGHKYAPCGKCVGSGNAPNPAVRGDRKAGVPCTGVVGSLNQEDGK